MPEEMQNQQDGQPLFNQQMEEQMSPEEMQSNLDGLMEKVDEKVRSVNAKKFMSDNKSEQDRIAALKEVLNHLEEAGIDLNDQQAINEFMQQMEEEHPDLYELFVESMNSLLDAQPEENIDINQQSDQAATSPSDMQGLTSMMPQQPEQQSTVPQGPESLGNLSAMMPQQ